MKNGQLGHAVMQGEACYQMLSTGGALSKRVVRLRKAGCCWSCCCCPVSSLLHRIQSWVTGMCRFGLVMSS